MRVQFVLALLISSVPANAQAPPASQSTPPLTKTSVQIVQRARQILDSPAKWNRADNRRCPAGSTTFSLYCALEKATLELSGSFEHRGTVMQEARFVIEEIAPNIDSYEHRLMGYNNDPTTTFADVQMLFDLLEARIANLPQSGELQIAKRAHEILNSESKWNRSETQICLADATTLGLYCAYQKAAKETNRPLDRRGEYFGDAIREARLVISETAPNRAKYKARLVDYNNDPTTSFNDIQALFRQVEDRLSKRMPDKSQTGK